LKISLIRTF